jgi:CheY-like chemotaxis protein
MSLKIMVVDDEPLSARVIRSLAVPLGHKVLTFGDSAEANQQAQNQRFDLVFVGMPRADGLELTQGLHRARTGVETTVVMLSAVDDVEIYRKAFGAGASFVLPKPIAGARILEMLAAMETPGWKNRRHAVRLPLFTEVSCKLGDRELPMRSMNISESGMLLQTPEDVETGREVSLEFRLAEFGVGLILQGRTVRKEEPNRIGVEFTGLAPEEQNAIKLYVIGHAKDNAPPTAPTDFRLRRFWTQT